MLSDARLSVIGEIVTAPLKANLLTIPLVLLSLSYIQDFLGATTFGIMTLGILAFGILTLGLMTLSIM
jgi:hypothetical protein